MAERDHYGGLIDGANAEGWALWRLPDAKGLPPRPADIAGCDWRGRFVLVEVKEVEKFKGVGRLNFEPSQVRWLRVCAVRGGLALVVVKEPAMMRLVRVVGQGAEGPDGVGGGLVGVGWAELKRVDGVWRGWSDAVRAWEAD